MTAQDQDGTKPSSPWEMALTKPPPWACAHLCSRQRLLPSPPSPGTQGLAARRDREDTDLAWTG